MNGVCCNSCGHLTHTLLEPGEELVSIPCDHCPSWCRDFPFEVDPKRDAFKDLPE